MVTSNPEFANILSSFGLPVNDLKSEKIGSGHINRTFLVTVGNGNRYVLQCINTNVFKKPDDIADNLSFVGDFLKAKHPDYTFVAPVKTVDGKGLAYDVNREPWRLYPYIENTHTVDVVQSLSQAKEAAAAFGKFAQLLRDCDVIKIKPTIARFHDLQLRYEQFESALNAASADRKEQASKQIRDAIEFKFIVTRYNELINQQTLEQGIFHNDTKINNVLFDKTSGRAIAVIDLDTVMPGYFIYDLGDLLRTLVSPVSEEEKDITKIQVRKTMYDAVVEGYMNELQLRKGGPELASFAGSMMTYIMALRFLADFLRGDTYYHTTYPGQNLVRATNQLRLLELLNQ